ncbi:MAG: DUF4974 domain-containing protein [Odoribacter sp.]
MEMQNDIEDLILGHLSGNLLPEEEGRLEGWLSESEEHRQTYVEYAATWNSSIIGYRRKMGFDEKDWQRVEKKYRSKRRQRMVYFSLSVAASLLLIVGFGHLFLAEEVVLPKEETMSDLLLSRKPEKVRLILSSGREIFVEQQMSAQEAGTTILSDSLGLSYKAKADTEKEQQIVYNELIIPRSGEYRLMLADGTRIMLNAESSLRFPVRFSGDQREVWLSGEAYFEVARDERKPFIVHLDKASVKVLGTAFNVMAYQNEHHTEITLVEGRVDIGADGRHELLLPGKQVVINNTTLQMINREVDVQQYTSWKEGVLRFDDMSLEQLMHCLSRWFDIVFEFRQEELKSRLFTGGFKKYESIERILMMIQETNDVKFSVQDNKVIIDRK